MDVIDLTGDDDEVECLGTNRKPSNRVPIKSDNTFSEHETVVTQQQMVATETNHDDYHSIIQHQYHASSESASTKARCVYTG